MIIDPQQEHRRRATPEDVSRRRTALAVVRALHPEIARVQKRAAFLVSIAERATGLLSDPATLDAEAAALQTAVEAYSADLASQMDGLAPEIRNHGRILDTVRALQSVHAILDKARLGLAERVDPHRPMPAVSGFRLPAAGRLRESKLPILER